MWGGVVVACESHKLEALAQIQAPQLLGEKSQSSSAGLERAFHKREVEGSNPSSDTREPWCSGLTCVPVTDEIAGSNPVGSASSFLRKNL